MATSLPHMVCGLISSWWKSDRVRVSPAAGQFLRLQPGSLLTIHQQEVEIVLRTELAGTEPGVDYECLQAGRAARLKVRYSVAKMVLDLTWSDAAEERELHAADVQIWR